MNIHALISRSEGKEETETGEKTRARTKKHEYGDARRSSVFGRCEFSRRWDAKAFYTTEVSFRLLTRPVRMLNYQGNSGSRCNVASLSTIALVRGCTRTRCRIVIVLTGRLTVPVNLAA